MKVALSSWFLLACATIAIYEVSCESRSAVQAGKADLDLIDALIGFKPCLDEKCEYGPTKIKPKDPSSKVENPRAHCMLLKPSAVEQFAEVERVYPGTGEIKYRLLEELIDNMHYASGSFRADNCKPTMKLLDLVILAASSLKHQYKEKGLEECIYDNSEDESSKPVPEPEMPCLPESSEYVTGTSVICPGSTIPSAETPAPVTKPTEKPYVPGSTEKPITDEPHVPSSTQSTAEPEKPCPDDAMEKPYEPVVSSVPESSTEETEIIAEEDEYEVQIPQVGSLKGIPGVHYPNYTDIPITQFTCADKKYIPGFYADLETGCQVFHVCYEHRRESFLCPLGTIFNQPILACDYWYSSNCSLAAYYYDVNKKTELKEEEIDEELLTLIAESEETEQGVEPSVENALDKITPFFPVKAVVTEIKPEIKIPSEPAPTEAEEMASEIVDKIAITATKAASGAREVIKSIPEPVWIPKPVKMDVLPVFKKPMKMADLLKEAVVPLAKAKLAAIPISKVTAMKTAVPVAGLAAKAKVMVPVAAAKAKLATKVAAIPAVKMAAAAPVIAKSKLAAAAIPAAKVAVAAPILGKVKMAAVPAAKVAVAAPILGKVKMAAVPAAKVAVAAPILGKVKMVAIPAAKAAVSAPVIAKGKIAVPAAKMAATKVAVKSSIPAIKAKMIASAVPLAKSKIVPLMKAKVIKSAGTPLLKAKMLALPLAKGKLAGPIPLAKVKLAKAAAISPLTKKALALGYMKLLKAKKIALMG